MCFTNGNFMIALLNNIGLQIPKFGVRVECRILLWIVMVLYVFVSVNPDFDTNFQDLNRHKTPILICFAL